MDNNQTNEQKEKLEIKIRDLETKIGEQDGRLNHLQSSGFQLANFYFVFQGVILTAIANGTSAIRFRDRWFLFILSLLAATLNLVSLLVIGRKYNRTLDEQEQSWFQCSEMHRELGALGVETQPPNSNKERKVVDPFAKCMRTYCLRLCMTLFVSVSIIMIAACWTIGRREEPDCKHPSYSNDNCFRLCNEGKCMSICNEF